MIEYHNFTVCIVNYYTSNIIPNVLNSLRDFQDKNNMRIDVHIFNNSKDDNLDDVLKSFPSLCIKVYFSEKNIGYTGAIRKLHQYISKYKYSFFINPDCIFTTSQLESFIDKLKNKSFGAAVCNITNGFDGPEFSGIATITDNNKISYNQSALGAKFAVGAFILYNLDALSAVGSFNDKYFMYWEDCDISVRLQKSGHKIISIQLDKPIKHAVGHCSNTLLMKIRARYFFYKGLYLFRKSFKKGETIDNVEYI